MEPAALLEGCLHLGPFSGRVASKRLKSKVRNERKKMGLMGKEWKDEGGRHGKKSVYYSPWAIIK